MKITAFCLVALALASSAYGAPKQIVIAPPPPPAAQSGIGPGLIFGFVIKGFTNSTFGSTQINQLCAALINFTTGYPKTALKCYLGPEGVNPYPGDAVLVTGFLQWQNFPGMTAQDSANAVISRDAAEFFLQNNAVGSLNTAFPGIMVDCSCNPFYGPNNFGPETSPIPGVPFASCTTQPKSNPDDTLDSVGIDNGKVCPTGPQYIVPASGMESANLAGTGSGIDCTFGSSTYTCRLTANAGTLVNMMVGQQIDLRFSGLDNTDACTTTQDDDNAVVLQGFEGPITAVGTNFIEFTAALSCTADGPASWTGDVPGAEITIFGLWSPLCDSEFAFYKANNPIQEFSMASMPSIGYTCPGCSSSSGTNAVLFSYAGPNKGKFCSKFPLTNGVNGVARTYSQTSAAGTSCIEIYVDTGSLATTGGKAMLTTPLAPGIPMSAVFPGIASSIVPFNGQDDGPVAIDSQMMVPCSTPALSKAPTAGAIAGIVDKGTCNTVSAFSNGGTGTNGNGIPLDTDTCAILTTVINGPLAPGASPPVVPSPAASPKPAVPSPAVGPSPSPIVPDLKCTYSGVYRIRPYYAPCSNKFIAWASPANCSNAVVNLRSANQLGGKLQRTAWALSTSSIGKVGVPANIVAPKQCGNRFLAAPAKLANGLKLGGNAWKWQVVPAMGSKSCDNVNLISENRLQTTAFLSVPKLPNNKCSYKFVWASKDGGRQRFRITKV